MAARLELGLHHTTAFVSVSRPGLRPCQLHTLYLLEGENAPQPFIPLLVYVLEAGRARSLSWQRNVTFAVGLLVDFAAANAASAKQLRPEDFFHAFAEALVAGTVHVDGHDPSGLFWEPRSVVRAKHLLSCATAFSDWAVNRIGSMPLNALRPATWIERLASLRRSDRRSAHALLGHDAYRGGGTTDAGSTRLVGVRRKALMREATLVKAFDSTQFERFLLEGFDRPNRRRFPFHARYRLRDLLITLLLHGGGLRLSEPFHLFVSDIRIDPRNPDSAEVRLFHPEQGLAPPDYVDPLTGQSIVADREEYLRVKYGLKPRNLVEGRFHAGWKDLYLSDGKQKFALVHWFPTYWGEAFLALFRLYITHSRSRHCNHPYLFVSERAEVEGAPYTVDSFAQAHARAVRRIGLVPRRDLGTTPHGHRHAYGQALAEAGIDRTVMQRALHHRSPWSQDVYTAPQASRIARTLKEAQERMDDAPSLRLLVDPLSALLGNGA